MTVLPNIHPGDILLEEFLEPLGISQNALARATGVPPRRINEIVLGKRGITADTAVRLAAALGTSERFWLGLQADYELEQAHRALGICRHGSSGWRRDPHRVQRMLPTRQSAQAIEFLICTLRVVAAVPAQISSHGIHE